MSDQKEIVRLYCYGVGKFRSRTKRTAHHRVQIECDNEEWSGSFWAPNDYFKPLEKVYSIASPESVLSKLNEAAVLCGVEITIPSGFKTAGEIRFDGFEQQGTIEQVLVQAGLHGMWVRSLARVPRTYKLSPRRWMELIQELDRVHRTGFRLLGGEQLAIETPVLGVRARVMAEAELDDGTVHYTYE